MLNPLRPGGSKGHRLYSFQELDKLAIIRELQNAGVSPTDIPPDIDQLWQAAIATSSEHLLTSPEQQNGEGLPARQDQVTELSINQRIEDARQDLFWRYFVSHILHMSLLLISKDVPRTTLGLVLPLNTKVLPGSIKRVEDLSELGTSLIAVLGKSRSSQTLLTERPAFEYATDFRLLPLTVMTEDQLEEAPRDNTLIYLQRRSRRLTLNTSVAETIRHLLRPLYEDAQRSYTCFGPGMRNVLISSTDLQNDSDLLLNGLVEMAIRLGGQTAHGQPRWRFCCILLPKDTMLPLHQRSLVVRVQSRFAPHTLGETTTTPDAAASSLSIRALQSGHIVYLPKISHTDNTTPFGKKDEGPVRSAIAIPIGGENGLAVAVLYVASDEVAAFSANDQRVLRILCVIADEHLKSYFVRQRAVQKLADIVNEPSLVDAFFKSFRSENDFIYDVEQLLDSIQNERQERFVEQSTATDEDTNANSREAARWCFSFISVDIDKQSSLANIHGDRVARNLAHKVGIHIQELLRVAFKEYPQCRLYYIYADRFYILLEGFTPEHARTTAQRLKQGLAGSYKLDALRTSVDYPQRAESMLELSNITVRLGVTSYEYEKLKEILDQHPSEDAVAEVRSIISSALNTALDIGWDEGGNTVVAWDQETRRFIEL